MWKLPLEKIVFAFCIVSTNIIIGLEQAKMSVYDKFFDHMAKLEILVTKIPSCMNILAVASSLRNARR